MINLIPQDAKRAITIEYWIRVSIVWLFLLGGVTLAAAFLLLPVYKLVSEQVRIYEGDATVAMSDISKNDLSSGTLIKAGVQAGLVNKLADRERFTAVITFLRTFETPSVKIERLSLRRTGSALAPIELTGTALTRQALADFREALLTNERIASVVLPIANLAQDKNITFTITLTLASSTPST